MRILYNDVVRKTVAKEEEIKADFCKDLGEMLAASGCVLIATPFAGKTLITDSTLAQFKPHSRLVNIARGSLVDEDALADALESGRLCAAGLDVHANEPRVSKRKDHRKQTKPFWSTEDVQSFRGCIRAFASPSRELSNLSDVQNRFA